MAYCTNCGTENKNNSKFCPNCGTEIAVNSDKSRRRPPPKRKMQKGVVKSIQDETKKYVKSKAEESFTSKIPKEKVIKSGISETRTIENKTTVSETASSKKTINNWTWIYIIMNGLLILLNIQSDEVMGVLIFSVLILGIVFFRRKNEKPYNWLVKIILVVQLVLLLALIIEDLEYFSLVTLLLIGVLITNIILLFKGNNS